MTFCSIRHACGLRKLQIHAVERSSFSFHNGPKSLPHTNVANGDSLTAQNKNPSRNRGSRPTVNDTVEAGFKKAERGTSKIGDESNDTSSSWKWAMNTWHNQVRPSTGCGQPPTLSLNPRVKIKKREKKRKRKIIMLCLYWACGRVYKNASGSCKTHRSKSEKKLEAEELKPEEEIQSDLRLARSRASKSKGAAKSKQ